MIATPMRAGALALALTACAGRMSPQAAAPERASRAQLVRAAADSAARLAIESEQSLDPAAFPARSVGVAPLAVDAADSSLAPLGYGLADLLITDLSRSAQLQVVDRTRVDALLQELHLARGGGVDSATAPRVGRLVGARRIVDGALAPLPGGHIVVSARVADASQGSLVGAPITTRTSLAGILDAEKALAFRIFDDLGVTLTPAERAAVEQRPTRYLSAFLAYSRGVRAEAMGDWSGARAYYQRAELIDPGFRAAARNMQMLPPSSTPAMAPLPPPSPPSAVVDALNPSPVGTEGVAAEQGDANERATFQSATLSTILIGVWTP